MHINLIFPFTQFLTKDQIYPNINKNRQNIPLHLYIQNPCPDLFWYSCWPIIKISFMPFQLCGNLIHMDSQKFQVKHLQCLFLIPADRSKCCVVIFFLFERARSWVFGWYLSHGLWNRQQKEWFLDMTWSMLFRRKWIGSWCGATVPWKGLNFVYL